MKSRNLISLILKKKNFFSTINNNNSNNSNNNLNNKKTFWNYFSLVPRVKLFVHTLGLTNDEDLSNLVAKSVNIGVYSIITMTFLGTIGFDTKPIIAGLSVFGFAAGYALKDAATHFAAGIMLVLQKPFQKGDFIKVLVSSPYEGVVEAIDVRYVHIRTKDQSLLLVPCSIVYGNSLIVSSSPPKDWMIKGPDTTNSTSPPASRPTPTQAAPSPSFNPITMFINSMEKERSHTQSELPKQNT